MARGKFVSYLRVSTDKQGASGLGIEAQRKAVEDYLNGGRWTLVREYLEVESGKRSDRPQLLGALAHAKATPRRWSSPSSTGSAAPEHSAKSIHFNSAEPAITLDQPPEYRRAWFAARKHGIDSVERSGWTATTSSCAQVIADVKAIAARPPIPHPVARSARCCPPQPRDSCPSWAGSRL
jgi:Resolvase, N terminal domain